MSFLRTAERYLTNVGYLAAFVLAVCGAYIAGPFPLMDQGLRLTGVIGLSATVIILTHPLAGKFPNAPLKVRYALWAFDLVLLIGFIFTLFNFFDVYDSLWDGVIILETPVLLVGLFGSLMVIECVRRVFDWILPAICVLMIVYAHYGDIPGIFGHKGFSFEESMTAIWFGFNGVFGRSTEIVSSIVLIFILFGAILEATNATQLLIKIAMVVTSRVRGGAAHAAIIASALFGTISGSSVGNVVGTGVFTIPLIKKQGFSSAWAGAVEAAASCGGQFTPPIMAGVAFLLAEYVGVPYYFVAVSAAVPALFYYYALFAAVYSEAVRLGIKPLPKRDIPVLTWLDWLDSLRFCVPLVVVVSVMMTGRSTAAAGFWAALSAVVVSLAIDAIIPSKRPRLKEYPRLLLEAFLRGGQGCASIMVAVASIGIFIAVVGLTGISGNFGTLVAQYAGGSLFLALSVAGAASVMLGMGLPTLPAYLFIVLFVGPVITHFGVEPLLVHLFVLKFAVLSSVTPPIAIAAFAAAPIAEANPNLTGWIAFKITLPGFIIPFAYVYYPSLTLMIDFEWGEFLWIVLRLMVVLWLVATAFVGHDFRRLSVFDRTVQVAAAVAMLVDQTPFQIGGLVVGVAMIAKHRLLNRIERAKEAGESAVALGESGE